MADIRSARWLAFLPAMLLAARNKPADRRTQVHPKGIQFHGAEGGKLKGARVVMISVDGERDTPAAMKSYLEPLSRDFIGLTGDPKATANIAAGFAAVFFKEPAGKDGSYNVMHSTQVFAVDKAGRLRASFAGASVEDMAKVTLLLLEEPG